MAINVRNDMDPALLAYAASLAGQKRAQARRQEQSAPSIAAPQELTLDGFSDPRRDMERLGRKQKAKYGPEAYADSYAGANWQLPITIWQNDDGKGVATGKVVYQNAGPDPLGSGAMGALGSGEKIVKDYGKQINTQDPEDLAKLGAVLEGTPSSGVSQIDDDFFKSKEELRVQEEQRKLNQSLEFQAGKAGINSQIQGEKQNADFEAWKRKQEFESAMRGNKTDLEKTQSAVRAMEGYRAIDRALPSGDAQDGGFDSSLYSKEDIRKIKELREGINLAWDTKSKPIDKAHVLGQLYSELKGIRPQKQRQIVEGPDRVDHFEDGFSYIKKPDGSGYDRVANPKPQTPKPQKPAVQITPQQYADLEQKARNVLDPDGTRPPNPEQIAQQVQRFIDESQAINERFAPQQQQGPVQVRTPQEKAALPPGTQYIAPDGTIRVKQ